MIGRRNGTSLFFPPAHFRNGPAAGLDTSPPRVSCRTRNGSRGVHYPADHEDRRMSIRAASYDKSKLRSITAGWRVIRPILVGRCRGRLGRENAVDKGSAIVGES